MHVRVCLCSYDEILAESKRVSTYVWEESLSDGDGDLSLRASWLPNKLLQLVMIMLGDAWFIFPSFFFLCDEHMQPGEEEHCACLSSNTASSTPCTMSKELGSRNRLLPSILPSNFDLISEYDGSFAGMGYVFKSISGNIITAGGDITTRQPLLRLNVGPFGIDSKKQLLKAIVIF